MINLVTTRDQKYWPKEGDNILMGPWCLPKEALFDENNLHTILLTPFDDEQLEKATEEVYIYYEDVLEVLSSALNKVHGVVYSKRYWRILLGPYLFYFTNAVYDRYMRLAMAIKLHPNIKLPILAEESFTENKVVSDFIDKYAKDPVYGFQLITLILKYQNCQDVKFYQITDACERENPSDIPIKSEHSFFSRMKRSIYRKLNNIASQQSEILLYKIYHPEMLLAKLMFYSKGKISHINKCEVPIVTHKKSSDFREDLRSAILVTQRCPDEFSNILQHIVVDELPIAFLEGYKNLKEKSARYFKKYVPKKIGSSIGWYCDEYFSTWVAQKSENGVQLIGAQHGGNYGVLKSHFSTDHEIKITDNYCTWGWDNSLSKCRAAEFILTHNKSETVAKEGVLFVSTAPALNFIALPIPFEHSREYLKIQKVFFSHCDDKFLPFIKYRPYLDDSVWDAKENLKKAFPLLNFDDTARPFMDSLNDCKLFVCDHLSTTYLQALSLNKPTVLFWDPKKTVLNDHAKPWFDELRRVKILHASPESSAKWMQEVYDKLDDWWLSDDCQSVVKKFCNQYAKTSHNPVRDWHNVLSDMA